jgi:hydrogenase maturation protease
MANGKVLVLGLGNTLISDDGVGIYIVRVLRKRLEGERYDFREASIGGVGLLDLIAGYEKVVIADCIKTGKNAPGHLYKFRIDDFKASTHPPFAGHSLSLGTVMQLGEQLGYEMPRSIRIYAVEIKDNQTMKEHCTAQVEDAIGGIVKEIVRELKVEEGAKG